MNLFLLTSLLRRLLFLKIRATKFLSVTVKIWHIWAQLSCMAVVKLLLLQQVWIPKWVKLQMLLPLQKKAKLLLKSSSSSFQRFLQSSLSVFVLLFLHTTLLHSILWLKMFSSLMLRFIHLLLLSLSQLRLFPRVLLQL